MKPLPNRKELRRAPNRRRNYGNMLVFIIAVTATLILALLFFMFNYVRLFSGKAEHANPLEAASLAAANELAKVVIEDDHYGLIALSDYPPMGANTRAGDQEPLPVFSINTILGTTRLDLIIANEINNPVMISLAKEDIKKARLAAKTLNDTLEAAVTGQGSTPKDIDGNPINVFQTAKQTYINNLASNTKAGTPVLNSLTISLGWIDGECGTITEVPKPNNKGQVPPEKQQNGRYKAFVNIPAYGEDFYFAGVGERAALVDVRKWQPKDGFRVLSAIRVESDHTVKLHSADLSANNKGSTDATFHSAVAAIPPGNKDLYPPGQLNIGFPHGRVPGISSIRNILDHPDLKINPMPLYVPTGGDWPGSGVLTETTVIPGLTGGTATPPANSFSSAQVAGLGFYDWLRSGRTKPRIDAVIALVDKDLFSIPGANGIPSTYQTYTFTGCQNDANDPRLIALQSGNSKAQSGYLNLTTLGDVWNLIPLNATTLQGNQSGANTTTGGNPFNSGITKEFWDGMSISNQTGWQAYNTAMAIINDPLATPQAKSNAAILRDRAKWVIYASYHLSQQVKTISAKKLQKDGPNLFQTEKMNFANPAAGDWTVVFNPGGLEHDKINFALSAPTAAQAASGTGMMNAKPNEWFHSTIDQDSSSFFFAGIPSSAAMLTALPDPGLGMVVGGGGAGGAAAASPNPNPPVAANNAIHLLIKNDGTIQMSYGLTPFANIPISENQIYAVALGALTTGQENQVTWTATMRDQVRKWGRTAGGSHAGQASAGSPPDYINNPAFGGVPGSSNLSFDGTNFLNSGSVLNPQPRRNYMSGGLSVEWQFRNPLVLKCNQGQQQQTNNGATSGAVVPELPAELF